MKGFAQMNDSTPLDLSANNPAAISQSQAGAICGQVQPTVTPAQKTELTLNPSKEFPRRLILEIGITSHGLPYLTVAVYVKNRYIGGINASLSEASYLDITTSGHSFLCVERGPTYQVSDAEANRIRATFAQLRVRGQL